MNQQESPESEGAARAAQFAAMSLTLIEAMARLRSQKQAERVEADERSAHAARAERIASHASARVVWSPVADDDWLRAAGTVDVGRAWSAAMAWADTDAEAADVARRAESRLHQLHPDAMAEYVNARAQGLDPSAAMQRAADQFIERPRLEGAALTAPTSRSPQDIAEEGFPLPASAAVQRRPAAATSTHVITSVPDRRAQAPATTGSVQRSRSTR